MISKSRIPDSVMIKRKSLNSFFAREEKISAITIARNINEDSFLVCAKKPVDDKGSTLLWLHVDHQGVTWE